MRVALNMHSGEARQHGSVPTFDELVTNTTEALRTEGLFVVNLDVRVDDEIKLHRSAGRRAERNLG